MRESDWSSDVCSSDLLNEAKRKYERKKALKRSAFVNLIFESAIFFPPN